MPKFLIERNIPGAGNLTPEQLQAISQTSCGVLNSMGPQIQWIESYVTQDKVFCVYRAPDEAAIREHGRRADFRWMRCIRSRLRLIRALRKRRPHGTMRF